MKNTNLENKTRDIVITQKKDIMFNNMKNINSNAYKKFSIVDYMKKGNIIVHK